MLIGQAGDPPAWLATGAPYGSPIACCPRVADARDLLDRWGALVVLAPLEDADGDDTLPLIEHLVHRRQPTAVVGMVSRQLRDSDDLLRLARAGVHTLLFDEDRRTPLTVRRALLVASTRCRNETLWSDVAPITPGRVRPLVAYGLKHAHEALTVDTVARALGLHRKTLAERCMLSRSLPPQLMLGWCRMMAAAVLLEDRGRLVDHIALELDFASGTAFRNQLKRYTGLKPVELRARGPLAEMTRRFRQAMQQAGPDLKVSRIG
jgi:AraC-like DNA-binding protein